MTNRVIGVIGMLALLVIAAFCIAGNVGLFVPGVASGILYFGVVVIGIGLFWVCGGTIQKRNEEAIDSFTMAQLSTVYASDLEGLHTQFSSRKERVKAIDSLAHCLNDAAVKHGFSAGERDYKRWYTRLERETR